MGIRKWLMKQYWRLTQVRSIYSIIYGILTLAAVYVVFIPVFADQGLVGTLMLAGTIFLVFLILGFLYDRVFVMWSPQAQVMIERDPYQYVPTPLDRILWFPWISTLLNSMEQILGEMNLDDEIVKEVREYYSSIQALTPSDDKNLKIADELVKRFIKDHPFANVNPEE